MMISVDKHITTKQAAQVAAAVNAIGERIEAARLGNFLRRTIGSDQQTHLKLQVCREIAQGDETEVW